MFRKPFYKVKKVKLYNFFLKRTKVYILFFLHFASSLRVVIITSMIPKVFSKLTCNSERTP